jgi:predicted MPP superfamily phosphohydrolase
MKIRVFGDLHGRDFWKDWVDARWVDRYVFLGDYVDEFQLHDVQILRNLRELLKYKADHPRRVVLLYGNHDLHYLYGWMRCSGFRQSYSVQVGKLLRDAQERQHIQMAYQYTPKNPKENKVLFTHAGVSKGWIRSIKRFLPPGTLAKDMSWGVKINKIFETSPKTFSSVSGYRGGLDGYGSPVWADQREFTDDPSNVIPHLDQIVGHQPVRKITVKKFKNSQMIWCDTMSHNDPDVPEQNRQQILDLEVE